MTHCFSRRSFLKGSAAAAAALTSPLLPADAAFSETENGLFSPVSALCQTQYGPVRGREGENGQLCWYGIPYGAAPTGESRWTAPQEPARWLTVRDCTSPAPAAYQYTTFPLGTEDCLTLDIYSSAEAKKRPVLVYLHGSAATGSSLELPGSVFAVLIVVLLVKPAGHRPGAGLGAGQHPPLRRRRRQHHPLRFL